MVPGVFVSSMVGVASPEGRLSEWEDVVAMAAGGAPVGRRLSGWGMGAVTMTVEMVFVGGCPSGRGVVATIGAACEERPSGCQLSITIEECLVEL